jgi:hypothetical protein
MNRILPNPFMRGLCFVLGAFGWGFYLVVNAVSEWCSETKRFCKEALRNDIND